MLSCSHVRMIDWREDIFLPIFLQTFSIGSARSMFLISTSACRIIFRSVCIRARSSSKDRPCLCHDISFSLKCGDRLDYVLVYTRDSFVTDINQRTKQAMVSTSPSQFPYQSNWALSPSSLHIHTEAFLPIGLLVQHTKLF